MRHAAMLAGVLGLTVGSAVAACPTTDDLGRGIRLISTMGEVETFTRVDDHHVAAIWLANAGDAQGVLTVLMRGVYLLSTGDTTRGIPVSSSVTHFGYPVAAAETPVPTPGETWTVTVQIDPGKSTETEQHTYTFGASTTDAIGECTYDMVPIHLDYGDFYEVLNYLPDAGFAYYAEYGEPGQIPEKYVMARIEAIGQ